MSKALPMRRTNLDLVYDRGKGVTKDDKGAVRRYRKTAKQGQTDAQSNLYHPPTGHGPAHRRNEQTTRGTGVNSTRGQSTRGKGLSAPPTPSRPS